MPAAFLAIFVFALNCADASPAPHPSAARWHRKTSPHFEIYHESSWSPGSITLEMERLYSRLRLSVSMFAPWMTREKTRIYIYRDQASFLNGEFNPPKWSKGLAYFPERTVVVYDTGDIARLRAVAAHELSHLYFESFYGEKLKYPPVWLNEGLAVMMEDMSYDGEGPWSQALKYADGENFTSMESFFRSDPERLESGARISYWYLQAFAAVSYLFRPRTRLQFSNFCSLLRRDEPLAPALWKVYRVNGPGGLERPWREWLNARRNGAGSASAADFPASDFIFKPVQFQPFKFTNFSSTGTQ